MSRLFLLGFLISLLVSCSAFAVGTEEFLALLAKLDAQREEVTAACARLKEAEKDENGRDHLRDRDRQVDYNLLRAFEQDAAQLETQLREETNLQNQAIQEQAGQVRLITLLAQNVVHALDYYDVAEERWLEDEETAMQEQIRRKNFGEQVLRGASCAASSMSWL